MGYLQDMEQELRALLHETPAEYTDDEVVNFVKRKILESYKNGIQAAKLVQKGNAFKKPQPQTKTKAL